MKGLLCDLPDLFVTRGPFMECSPRTEDGIRRLARVAAEVDAPFARDYLDGLELLMLQVRLVKPEGCGRDDKARAKPIGIRHTERGIVVEWRIGAEVDCDACGGRVELTAWGKNHQDYDVECPECCGAGQTDGDEEYVWTDLDGNLVEEPECFVA